ncbi:MAG: glycosyltransferase family 4 protein [Nanoarchaeota archaeon]|nr:glycosyltransferase family 4 protein [Nanoarchaeota archaeon]
MRIKKILNSLETEDTKRRETLGFMKMKRICIISTTPEFLGGVSLYSWDVAKMAIESGRYKVFWIYGGKKNKKYKKDSITFVELKTSKIYPLSEIDFNNKVGKFLEQNDFDIINSHAIWGSWMNDYNKKKNQKIIHTYHGSTFHFFKNHLKGPGFKRKISSAFMAIFGLIIEGPPWKKADGIVCVSEHLEREFSSLYGKRKGVHVLRTGVDLKKFRKQPKLSCLKKLGLDKNKIYGLYVGRGGFWTKGLDKVISLSKEIYRQDNNFRLLVLGADKNKVSHLIKEDFVKILPPIEREDMPDYYNSSDIFFSMSRCEGGAPTMVTSEAMASGCLIVTDKEANQEVIEDGKNGMIIGKNYNKAARKILDILKNKRKLDQIRRGSLKRVKKLGLELWEKRYLKIFNYERDNSF